MTQGLVFLFRALPSVLNLWKMGTNLQHVKINDMQSRGKFSLLNLLNGYEVAFMIAAH